MGHVARMRTLDTQRGGVEWTHHDLRRTFATGLIGTFVI
jgi:hypothetical protein